MNTNQAPILFEKQVIITLKGIRRSKKITQTDLANRIGVSRDTIARIESGKARIYLAQVVAIADALDIMLQDLFLQDEQKEETRVFTNENMNLSNKNIHITYQTSLLSSRESENESEWRQYPNPLPAEGETKAGNPNPNPNPNPVRNPYLNEKAVDSYGEPMKKYILNHRLFWHWVPVDDLPGLSISSVVEATLNQGREEDLKWLFDTITVEKAADIFKQGISGFRTNYREEVISYFNAYFTRHVPNTYL